MSINVSIHASRDTGLGMTRSADNCIQYRTLDIGPDASVFFTSPEVARNMADLLIQIADELEQERNPCVTA